MQATLFLQSMQSRATRSMLDALQEGEQTIAVFANTAIYHRKGFRGVRDAFIYVLAEFVR